MLSVTTDGFLSDVTEEEIAVCLTGVQVTVEASNDLDGEAYKRLHNERMLNLYLDRRPGKKILLKQFPAIRDQWEKGVDLFKFEKRLVSARACPPVTCYAGPSCGPTPTRCWGWLRPTAIRHWRGG